MSDGAITRLDEHKHGPTPCCGDKVFHRPSRETWLVAYADTETNDMSWFGWPEGRARLSDCRLIYRATDVEHRKSVGEWLKATRHDHRVSAIRRLYPDVVGSFTETEGATHG